MENDQIEKSNPFGNKPGMAFFHFVIRFAGRKTAYFFLFFIVFVYSILFPSIKAKTDPYLSRRFPHAGPFGRMKHRYLLILNFGRILIDKTVIGILGKGSMQVSFRDFNDVEKIKSIRSGFILLLSHVGCWQVVMSALDMLKKPVNLVMLRDEKDINKHFFEYRNNKNALKIINPEEFLGGTIEMLNVLNHDEILCIMGDRVFKNKDLVLEMDFLSGKAIFPSSAFKLSSICQKPIVVLDSYKIGSAAYELKLSDIIHVPRTAGKTKDGLVPFVREYVESLEFFTQNHPYQFFNFFDMWDDDQQS